MSDRTFRDRAAEALEAGVRPHPYLVAEALTVLAKNNPELRDDYVRATETGFRVHRAINDESRRDARVIRRRFYEVLARDLGMSPVVIERVVRRAR